jgi:hypothetical protein
MNDDTAGVYEEGVAEVDGDLVVREEGATVDVEGVFESPRSAQTVSLPPPAQPG